MRKLAKVAEWMGTFLIGLVVLVAVLLLVGPRLGWNTHPVLSGSMEPALGVGGVIVTMPVQLDEVRVGDIITFQSGNQRVTHRVIEIVRKAGASGPTFITKGDANPAPDASPVLATGDRGTRVVLYVPYLGYLANMAQDRTLFLLLIGVPTLLLLLLLSRDLRRGFKEERAKRDPGCAEDG